MADKKDKPESKKPEKADRAPKPEKGDKGEKTQKAAKAPKAEKGEAGEGAAEIVIVRRAAVRLLEQTLVSRIGVDACHGAGSVRMSHLDGIENRQLGLFLERRRAAVPELALQHGGIHYGRRTAFSEVIADPFRYAAMVGEAAADVVAGGASQGAVFRQASIEIQLAAQGNAVCGQFIARRHIDRRPGQRVDARRGCGEASDQLIQALLLLLHRHCAMRCGCGLRGDTERTSGGERETDQHGLPRRAYPLCFVHGLSILFMASPRCASGSDLSPD